VQAGRFGANQSNCCIIHSIVDCYCTGDETTGGTSTLHGHGHDRGSVVGVVDAGRSTVAIAMWACVRCAEALGSLKTTFSAARSFTDVHTCRMMVPRCDDERAAAAARAHVRSIRIRDAWALCTSVRERLKIIQRGFAKVVLFLYQSLTLRVHWSSRNSGRGPN
jgi:hypothetical protein